MTTEDIPGDHITRQAHPHAMTAPLVSTTRSFTVPHSSAPAAFNPTRARQFAFIQRILGVSIYILTSLIGIAAFLYPFFSATQQNSAELSSQMAHSIDSPLVLVLLIGLCIAALAIEAQGQAMSAKLIALLGILVAINSALRFAETVVRGPGGFVPIFLLIILTGYVFGSRFGFLMGILTMLVSAIITAGIGPWLPYQMFTAGWMGMSAGWLPKRDVRKVQQKTTNWESLASRVPRFTRELVMLMVFGAVWGFVYGAILNLWFWPYQSGNPTQSWQAGLTLLQGIQRYLAFYLATSFIWDIFGAIGNIGLMLLFGVPTLKALWRFKNRFLFVVDDRSKVTATL